VAKPVPDKKLYPKTALALLTALNLLNYIDRNVLFAVQDLIKQEFPRSDAAYGLLTSVFFIFYMLAAPFMGPLSEKYSRKAVIIVGAIIWSGATLLTAFTKNFDELLIRHTLVGIGEASFVILSPTFVADMFPEEKRGRVMGIFYLAIPVGSALGFLVGGVLGPKYGWRVPFYVGAAPSLLLAFLLLFVPEPPLGQFDEPGKIPEPSELSHESTHGVVGYLVRGLKWISNLAQNLIRNPAFITATLGMAMMTFALGGLQVWFPTFLHRVHRYTLTQANILFGASTIVNGIVASLAGGWISDWLLRRTKAAHYLVSAVSLALGIPAMCLAIFGSGNLMIAGMFTAEFFLLLNTGPLNAAIINSVGPHVRAMALAANIFIFHLLGDVPSAPLIGYMSDHFSMRTAFIAPVIAICLSSAILFYGMKFAPPVSTQPQTSAVGAH
jgi:MFS transporter, Spinster family, sphingosine-1-phosphate transporter